MSTRKPLNPQLFPIWLAALLLALSVAAGGVSADSEVGLSEAVSEALASNLDLAAQRRALAASREEIGLARSNLLPQIDLGAKATRVNQERSHDGRGNITQESVTVAAKLSQVLYDDADWANYGIEKHLYQEQESQFESFELGVVQDAADAFLEFDRAQALVVVQEQNRALTASNLETSRARIAAGYSSEREVLRWESQLAANDRSVVEAQTRVLVSMFELNRVRNQQTEARIKAIPAGIKEYGFVYSRESIVKATMSPEGDRKLRDYFVRVGVARSPDIRAIVAAIAAAKRRQVADQRAFWLPTFNIAAGVNHLAAHGDNPDFNSTEWGVGAGVAFPLLQGGAKFAQISQSRENLASLGLQRRSIAQQIERAVRSAFAEASGSYTKFGLAQNQESTALRNFELVDQSFALGVASVLSLLDAQSLLLKAQLARTNAHYDFLEDMIAAERAISIYPFTESAADANVLLDDLERMLAPQP